MTRAPFNNQRIHKKIELGNGKPTRDDGLIRRPDNPPSYNADGEITVDTTDADGSPSAEDPKDEGTGNMKLFLVVGAGLLGAALAPVAAPAALGLIGFGSNGVVLGSTAAAIQSSIGNVAAGSLFATAQNVAMGGAFPAMGSVIASGFTGVGAFLVIPGGKKPRSDSEPPIRP